MRNPILFTALLPLCLAGCADDSVSANGRLQPAANGKQWTVELEIQRSDLARLRKQPDSGEDFDVQYLTANSPTSTYLGKLRLQDVKESKDTPDVAIAAVRVHSVDGDLPEQLTIPPEQLVAGAKVTARITP